MISCLRARYSVVHNNTALLYILQVGLSSIVIIFVAMSYYLNIQLIIFSVMFGQTTFPPLNKRDGLVHRAECVNVRFPLPTRRRYKHDLFTGITVYRIIVSI